MSNIVIVGSGPAGVSAALYAVRAGVQTTVLTKGSGALARAETIENYYGRSPGRSWSAAASRTPGGWGCNSCRPRPWG